MWDFWIFHHVMADIALLQKSQFQCAQKPETRKNLKLFGKVNITAIL
jgi:hypothetical protein